MFTRSKDIEGGTITATLTYDNGDPSVGIGPGWGEETFVEYQVDGWTAYLTWREWQHAILGRTATVLRDPADWIVDTFEIASGPEGKHLIPTPLMWIQQKVEGSGLRLSELPAALEVVRLVLDDYNASERLYVAQESLWVVSSELDSVLHDAYEHQGLRGIALLNKLDELRNEEKEAQRELEIATIIYRDQFGIRDYNNMRGIVQGATEVNS